MPTETPSKKLDLGAVLSLECNSIVSGYRALDALTRSEGIKIIDASPSGGGRFLILASGSPESVEAGLRLVLSQLKEALNNDIVDHAILERATDRVIEALYSLPQVLLEESLIIVECATLTGLLASAEALIGTHGAKCIELKIQRSTGSAYGFFTGSSKACASAAEEVRTRLKTSKREGRVEVIDQPVASFRAYFNFAGEN